MMRCNRLKPLALAIATFSSFIQQSAGASGQARIPQTPVQRHPRWVAAWAQASSGLGGGASHEQTFRLIVKPSVGSRGTVRLRFSNHFGLSPVSIGAVRLSIQSHEAAVGPSTAITFHGTKNVTVPAGKSTLSDEVQFSYKYGEILAISEYVVGGWSDLSGHTPNGGQVTSYASPPGSGDVTSDVSGKAFDRQQTRVPLLDRIDVYGDYAGTLAAFGSSTTDGVQSGLDRHMTWPEQLAERLHAAGRDDVAIANMGIAGNEMLKGGDLAGIKRFSRDVLGLPNVFAAISYLGANDLRSSCVRAEELVQGTQDIIRQAHAARMPIWLGITAPSTFCRRQRPSSNDSRFAEGTGEERERLLVSRWMRSKHAGNVNGVSVSPPEADRLIDFDAALRDPSNRSYMLAKLNSGDDIHPNALGYGAMARSIPLDAFPATVGGEHSPYDKSNKIAATKNR